MSESLLDVLTSGKPRDGRIMGVVTGIVTNNQDPDGLGRVKVRFPWLSDEVESWWARVAVLMAGTETGTWFLPDVDDEVLVAFEHGDPNYPYVIGMLWSTPAKPPETVDEKNTKRTIKSRSGHIVRLDDTEGAEKIEIIDKTAKNSVVFDSAANTITITADADITLKSTNGKVLIDAKGGVEVKSGADVKVEAQTAVQAKSGTDFGVEAGTALALKSGTDASLKAGTNLELNGAVNAKLEAGAMGDVKAGAVLNVKGSLVNIN